MTAAHQDHPASAVSGSTDASAPLLIFDSGIGGLSVLSAIRRQLPDAPIVYAADHAFLPYGDKSEAEIAARVPALLGRLVERYKPRLVVIACNTACTIALPHVRGAIDVPVVGTVPAIKPAAEHSVSKVIGLLGTEATVRQAYVDQLHWDHAADCTLLRHAAPTLVLAAEAKLRGEAVDPAIFASAVAGIMRQPGGDRIDQIVLGCTHFPLLRDELSLAAGSNVQFTDGAAGIARRVGVLTRGQHWPSDAAAGIFVTTGALTDAKAYRQALTQHDLTKLQKL